MFIYKYITYIHSIAAAYCPETAQKKRNKMWTNLKTLREWLVEKV